jgi:hypothetical protein
VRILALDCLNVRDLSACHLEDVTVMRDENSGFYFILPDVQPGLNDSNRTSNPVSPLPTWPWRAYAQQLQAPKLGQTSRSNFAVHVHPGLSHDKGFRRRAPSYRFTKRMVWLVYLARGSRKAFLGEGTEDRELSARKVLDEGLRENLHLISCASMRIPPLICIKVDASRKIRFLTVRVVTNLCQRKHALGHVDRWPFLSQLGSRYLLLANDKGMAVADMGSSQVQGYGVDKLFRWRRVWQ